MYAYILAHIRDHLRQFYGNCRTLRGLFHRIKFDLTIILDAHEHCCRQIDEHLSIYAFHTQLRKY